MMRLLYATLTRHTHKSSLLFELSQREWECAHTRDQGGKPVSVRGQLDALVGRRAKDTFLVARGRILFGGIGGMSKACAGVSS